MQKLRVNDEVIVIAGKDKGKIGAISNINLRKRRALVSGVNMVKKAQKPTQENPSGGISEMEKSIDISNIALLSPETKKATRVRIESRDGKNVRVAVVCGTELK